MNHIMPIFAILWAISDLRDSFEMITGKKLTLDLIVTQSIKMSNLFASLNDFHVVIGFLFFGFTILQSFFLMQYLGLYGIFLIQITGLFVYWLSLFLIFVKIILTGNNSHIILFKWFTISSHVTVNFELYLDIISLSFALLTTTIAFFVLSYAFCYFRYEPNIDRLIILLSSFVWSMTLLVLAGNMFILLLGWELIGLTSFLLINFWSTRAGTFKSAFKAFTFNKVSDAALILVLVLLSITFKDLTIPTLINEITKNNLNHFTSDYKIYTIELVSVFILLAASIKSAQIIGHLWLPDSMEAPVPASALIHSATLVSAGIFLILRLYPILEYSWFFNHIIPLVGAITAAYGGLVAAYQTDVKRLLAYSTISHCGFLMLLTTFGSIENTLVYLYIHGFFKASSFMCIGNIIRFSKNYQDLRRMGNFWKYLPVELFILTLSLLNLSGAPFFWGFVCKHLILAATPNLYINVLVWSFTLFGALMGPLYSYRLITNIFFDNVKSRKSIILSVNRSYLNNINYSNTPIMGWLSIILLIILAYIMIFLMVYFLIWTNNLFTDLNFLKLINQSVQINTAIKMNLFNISLFNWINLLIWFSVIFIKWNDEYNSNRKIEILFFFIVSLFFGFIFLKVY